HNDVAVQSGRTTWLATECKFIRAGPRCIGTGLQAKLQVSRLTNDPLGLGRVLHTWQLHHDTVTTLPLYQRLSHAQFVHPVAQRRQVLLDRIILDGTYLSIGQSQLEQEIAPPLPGYHFKIGELAAHQTDGALTLILLLEHRDCAPVTARFNRPITDFLFPHTLLDFAHVHFQALL